MGETSSEVALPVELELIDDSPKSKLIGDSDEENDIISEAVLSEELELLEDKEEELVFEVVLSEKLELLDE